MKIHESFWDKQLEIDAKEEATNPENIAYKILKADVNKRQILKKMDEFVIIPESLIEDSMTYLVWDMLGLREKDGEYYGNELLSNLYYGSGGVVDGGVKIDDYINEIIRVVGLQNEQ